MTSTASKLVIVESPTKAKTIRKFLGKEYRVEASMGHVRDLPSNADEIPDGIRKLSWARLGVNVEAGFEPVYVVPEKKKKVVTELRRALKDATELYVATDEDREGESIGWHLVQVLNPKVPTHRMVFHEITKEAIQRALANPRSINEQLVHAQEARRVLDRLVGYTVSPLLWKKVAPRLSAGRVQSVAVRMLVLRERERIAFVSASYWDIKARLEAAGGTFDAQLQTVDGRRVASGRDFNETTGQLIAGRDVLQLDEARTRALAEALSRSASWTVSDVERKETTRRPYPPFTTSTLQQEANRKLGMSARQTMQTAQRLYENGYITYMRTDSVNLSDEAVGAARSRVERQYGANYLTATVRRYATKAPGAQEAHEAIRPAGTAMPTADELGLSGQESRLYELIWMRTMATQMADARIAQTSATIEAQAADGQRCGFRASGREVIFPGFLRAYVEGADDPGAALDDRNEPLPRLDEGQALQARDVEPLGHETRPPARYTEASLVKALEAEGIGRPSTYATIIDTIQQRGYVVARNKQLVPTFTAMAVTALLEQTHGHVVDLEFTAAMESRLDEIQSATDAQSFLQKVYSEDVLQGVRDGEALDAREVCTIRYANLDISVRVGRYGPYVEVPEAGADKPRIVSLPAETAPADVTEEMLGDLIERAERGDEPLGTDTASGMPIYVLEGRYGPYLQLGSTQDAGEEKPKRVSIPKGTDPATLSLEQARALIALPRTLGDHPETGKTIRAGIGMYGPYVLHDKVYASLKPGDDVLTVSLDRAVQLLAEKARGRGAARAALRELGPHPEDGAPIEVHDGRYGPYVKHGKTNATLPRDVTPESVTLELAVELIKAREAAKPTRKTAAKKTAAAKKPAAAKKTTTKAATAKTETAKKATATKTATTKKATATTKTTAAKTATTKKTTTKKATTDDPAQ